MMRQSTIHKISSEIQKRRNSIARLQDERARYLKAIEHQQNSIDQEEDMIRALASLLPHEHQPYKDDGF